MPQVDRIIAGSGRLRVGLVDGASVVLGAQASDPLKFVNARHRGRACWCYATSFGGGLVAGDRLAIDCELGPDARLVLATQASTKVFRSDGPEAVQLLEAQLAPGSLLLSIPDPVCCFAGARYRQEQIFHCAAEASLVAVDWLSSGRQARGEHWQARQIACRTDLLRAGQPLVSDRLWLADEPDMPGVAERMGPVASLATVWLHGPLLAGLAAELVADLDATPAPACDQAILESCSQIGSTTWCWRLAGRQVEAVGQRIWHRLDQLAEAVGGLPWRRRP